MNKWIFIEIDSDHNVLRSGVSMNKEKPELEPNTIYNIPLRENEIGRLEPLLVEWGIPESQKERLLAIAKFYL